MELLKNGTGEARATLVLAHGAGAAMDSGFMNAIAEGLAARGVRVVRFEFPYMAARRSSASRKPPDPQPVLLRTWHEVLAEVGAPKQQLAIGGKSMGGRMASMIADAAQVAALVCLGYPFHPPGRPEQLRVEHLRALATPTLIVQGTRDAFGTQDEVGRYPLSPAIRVHWLAHGDHSFKPPRGSGQSERENLEECIEAVAAFLAATIAR
ncbi:MAG: alpha/beta fold hydrolase [Planctomycetota bacterium]